MSVKGLVKITVGLIDDLYDVAKGVTKTAKASSNIQAKKVADFATDTFRHASNEELKVLKETITQISGEKALRYDILDDLGIRNLRILENGNLSGGTFAVRNPDDLLKLKEAGVKRIVDFRGEASSTFEALCKDCDFEYLRLPLDNTRIIPGRDRIGFEVTDDFVRDLKKYFDMVDQGQTYQGCRFGIDRTNLGLTLNYLLNPKATQAPKLLSWDNYSMGNIVNRTTKTVKKIIKKLSPEQRKMLGLPDNFDEILQQRIFDLRYTNGVLRINKLQ